MDNSSKDNQSKHYDLTQSLNWLGVTALSYYHGPSWIFWMMMIPMCVGLIAAILYVLIK